MGQIRSFAVKYNLCAGKAFEDSFSRTVSLSGKCQRSEQCYFIGIRVRVAGTEGLSGVVWTDRVGT